MRRRGISGRTTVSVDIDLDEIVADIEDSDLLDELDARGLGAGISHDDLAAVHDALIRNRPNAALALVESLMLKKPAEYYQTAYDKAKALRDPESGRPLIN